MYSLVKVSPTWRLNAWLTECHGWLSQCHSTCQTLLSDDEYCLPMVCVCWKRQRNGRSAQACMFLWQRGMHLCLGDWPIQLAVGNAAPQAHGWAVVWETPVPPYAFNTHTHSSRQSALEECPYVGVNGDISHSPCPHTPSIDNGRRQELLPGVMGAMGEKIHRLYGRKHTTANQPLH